MKRRYVLQAGATMFGAIALSRVAHKSQKGRVLATSPSQQAFKQTSETQQIFEISKTEREWRDILSPEQFRVLRQHGTEWAGSSPLDQEYGNGQYHCAGCDLPVFSSEAKYNSYTGWPSFYAPIAEATGTTQDTKFNMVRTEVHCARCGGHLGHVFLDGPQPTGERYCINGVALKFVAA